MRTFVCVPKIGDRTVTLERSKKMWKLNQTAVLLSFVGLVGALSLFAPTHSANENPGQELSRLRKEVEKLTYENALMDQRMKNFRIEFNTFQEDFSTLGNELEHAASKRRPRSSDIETMQATMSDLNFGILGLESNMQFMEARVERSNPSKLIRATDELDAKLGGKSGVLASN
jgi:chromosome segregation ATPase